jgi:hypothetical protein
VRLGLLGIQSQECKYLFHARFNILFDFLRRLFGWRYHYSEPSWP